MLFALSLSQQIISPTDGGFGSLFTTFSLPPSWYKSDIGGMGLKFIGSIAGIILGGFIALSQAFTLSKRDSFLISWIAINAIGLQIVLYLTIFVTNVDVLLAGASIGFLYGLITALPLRRLLQSNV